MRFNQGVFLATLGALQCAEAVVVARAECKAYRIAGGDTCSGIASTRCGGIKLDDLYSYNSGLKDKCGNLKVRLAQCALKHLGDD